MIDPETEFAVHEIFHFQDGRTVLSGVFDRLPGKMVRLGRFGVWFDGECVGIVVIEGEMIASGRDAEASEQQIRSLATTEPFRLTRPELQGKSLVLKPIVASPKGEFRMHRHLIGIESPPPEYVPDPMTLGPVLPEGWDGDAWTDGVRYFLRAWNKASALIAIGRASTYEGARRQLLDEISTGARQVSIVAREAQTA